MYADDALSALSWRPEIQRLSNEVSAFSFDFFDTLFVRPLAAPEDAFDILAQRCSIQDFRKRRCEAQAEAFRRMPMNGRKEIKLEDIYACMAERGYPGDELMRAEYALELELAEANPEIFPVLHEVLISGKPVVITSDMYLPKDFFIEALRPHGLAHLPLFISADYNATKRDRGELFDIVSQKLGLPSHKILHIGDNLLSDVVRPRERGLMALQYRPAWEPASKNGISLHTSIGYGLLRTRARGIDTASFRGLGYIFGGPANFGFLQWIKDRACADGVEHVLFLSRDGYALERIARKLMPHELPGFCYFLGSRTAYTLACITAENFATYIPFLLSGADGLAPCELLERIGVQAPSHRIMDDLGLGLGYRIGPDSTSALSRFLYAYRWEILKSCRRSRRALFNYLRQIGLKNGSRVALVDVGWSGSTQAAFEKAVKPMMQLDVFGYYFCMADTLETRRRQKEQRMSAMFDETNTDRETIAALYSHRTVVEQFFSAPHHSVVGLDLGRKGIEAVTDAGRGSVVGLKQIAEHISFGVEAFSEHYHELMKRLNLKSTPRQIAWSMIDLIRLRESFEGSHLLKTVKNFDAWGSSRNHDIVLTDHS